MGWQTDLVDSWICVEIFCKEVELLDILGRLVISIPVLKYRLKIFISIFTPGRRVTAVCEFIVFNYMKQYSVASIQSFENIEVFNSSIKRADLLKFCGYRLMILPTT